MLPAAHRMRRSVDFERAVRRGARAGRSTVVVHLSRDPERGGGPLVGLVVSKAVGNAVRRNLVKRRLRSIAAGQLSRVPEDSLVVLRALPRAATAEYAHLERDVMSATSTVLRRLEEPVR
ncbi:ribonuclease P protein component [Isoptericola sediminis]|uniref:Ribonuclease P protein component n=1 Tax=Isoptericola sediminis TaxID=2733572 RepID=A0A849KF30_9MICO|nr:ribonuclease P protein component [Isoptericola sediminis]NNU27173.1 ribonuclease P protein component [Isoptericola sediminis]